MSTKETSQGTTSTSEGKSDSGASYSKPDLDNHSN